MEIADFIAAQEPERRELLERLHEVIVANDSTVVAVVEPMNFKKEEEVPADIIGRMISDCAPVDLAAIKAEYERDKKPGAVGTSASRPGKKK